jgi:hypothetical protein
MYANQLGNHDDPNNSFVPRGVHRLGFNGFWAAYNFHHNYYNSYYHTETAEKTYFPAEVYEPDGQTDMAIDWLRCRAQQSSRPFAMVLSWGTPHAPWTANNVPAQYDDNVQKYDLPESPELSVRQMMIRMQIAGRAYPPQTGRIWKLGAGSIMR